MKKISITINLSKIDKSKIIERTYTDNEGKEVTVKEYKADLIELKKPKFISKGETWELLKTHFLVEAQTKEERSQGKEDNFVGEGLQFRDIHTDSEVNLDKVFDVVEQEMGDIPF